jgi:CHAT domain-containing protein
LDIRRRRLGTAHTDTALSLRSLGLLAAARGDKTAAVDLWAEAVQGFEAARLRAAREGLARAAFSSEQSPWLYYAAGLARTGRSTEAWDAVEMHLGRGLLEEFSARRPRPLQAEETRRQQELSRQIDELNDQIASLVIRKTPTAEELLALERHLAERRQIEEQTARLALTIAQREIVSRAALQAVLPPDGAVVGWLDLALPAQAADPAGDHWAFVVRAKGEPRWVQLKGTGPNQAWLPADDDLAAEVGAVLAQPPRRGREDWRSLAAPLTQQRLVPLEPHLQATAELPAVRRLFVLPAPRLAGIPLETLTDRYTITYVPSGSILHRLLGRRPERTGAPSELLALGDPAFPTRAGSTRPDVAPLPGTRREVEAIVRLLRAHAPPEKATTLLGADATPGRLNALLAGDLGTRYRFIHLATHGQADERHALQSAVLLAPDRAAPPLEDVLAGRSIDDGRITARQIADRWKLDADLVTLSACQSALGKFESGEGHVGFAQALFLAGARSLVLSLWQVDDAATALLMARFYENLLARRLTKGEALREAKDWLRRLRHDELQTLLTELPNAERGLKLEQPDPRARPDDRGERPFAHPYYWSAFILLGDPE